MKPTYNIYCDESCHLLNDHKNVFVLGATWVEKDKAHQVFQDLRALKQKHNLSLEFETKWTKVSLSKIDYYTEMVEYFFQNDDLHFRGLVVPNKDILDHSAFGQDHNTWYYKMFYVLLNVILKNRANFNLYLDIKDTQSNFKVLELKRILNIASVEDVAVSKAQQIRSHEVELMQMTDILIGALSYTHRGLSGNEGKVNLIKLIETSVGKNIFTSTAVSESKFNVLVWNPRNQ
jgi:hypothetical protein